MRLYRVIHAACLKSPLASYRAPGRYHLTADEAKSTSYLAFSMETCVKEVAHHLGGTVPLRDRWAMEFAIDVDRFLDLTLASERKKLGVDLEDLVGDDLSVPQSLARRFRKKGIQALIVPSARDLKGRNFVLFLENVSKKAIRQVREERLD